MAAFASVSAARGEEAGTLSDIDASFDEERTNQRIPSIGVALVWKMQRRNPSTHWLNSSFFVRSR